jgi:ribosomal protein L21
VTEDAPVAARVAAMATDNPYLATPIGPAARSRRFDPVGAGHVALNGCRQAEAGDSGTGSVRPHPQTHTRTCVRACPKIDEEETMATYAIVKTGGKQYKVAVGDVVKVEKLDSEPGASVSLPVALVVDGADVTSDRDALAKISVTGEVLEHTKGPKIRIHKFKNKTGYHKRQGHRQQLTVLRVTGIK